MPDCWPTAVQTASCVRAALYGELLFHGLSGNALLQILVQYCLISLAACSEMSGGGVNEVLKTRRQKRAHDELNHIAPVRSQLPSTASL